MGHDLLDYNSSANATNYYTTSSNSRGVLAANSGGASNCSSYGFPIGVSQKNLVVKEVKKHVATIVKCHSF